MNRIAKRATLGAVSAGLVAMSFALASWAAPHDGHRPDFKPERMIERMADKLDLSAEQRSAATEIVTETSEATRAGREELRSLREQLHAMRGAFDEQAARQISDEIGAVTADMIYRRTSSHAAIYALLSPEQREEFDEMTEKRRKDGKGPRRHHRFGEG